MEILVETKMFYELNQKPSMYVVGISEKEI